MVEKKYIKEEQKQIKNYVLIQKSTEQQKSQKYI